MSSYYLSLNKGKQKVNPNFQQEKYKYAPEKLREDAVLYFKQLMDMYPQSEFRPEAEKTLKLLEAKK
jgi:outer membrane protein assembly factor BamD (BamD/ComL family)